MRVLVVTTWYPTDDAPFRTPFVPRHVRAIAEHHEVHVLHVELLDAPPVTTGVRAGIPVTRVGFDPRSPRSVLATEREIRRWVRYADVVHTMAFSSALVAAPVVGRTPWVHTEHWNGVMYPDHVNALWARLAWLRHVLRVPDVVTGVSTVMTSVLERFSRPGRTALIGNVVDHAEHVEPAPPGPGIRLVGVGAATAHKGIHLAVETVAWLRARGHDASLVWVGEGPQREAAAELARELGITEWVDLPGFRSASQVWQHLAEAHLFLLPSRSETFCVAAAEAVAAGRPVVMGSVGGQRDFVTPGNGRLVEPLTPEALGQAVLDVLADPATQSPQRMAEDVRAEYGHRAVADDFDTLYRRLVDPSRSCG